jgi:hypothetical protein
MAQQIGLFGAQPQVFVDDQTGAIVYYPAFLLSEESAALFAFLER